ncbi:hypothetical protein AMAG_10208 [Allomyces macrogynus ATCC 38327]|uniref:Secreted protein n=1 Tax=Allomyces macrogynus (strain ATCC 38327) TaxID=578462 RepID=A0A0L0SR75_ALLM3|nr:hypothetical protein AMAG_10208 [Allomyces macrogynus ATCC 38327]|eukprot:KNE64875.1 hypothetical protein AMAG_10208 [Allomyces macrogynus ATCC 38327]
MLAANHALLVALVALVALLATVSASPAPAPAAGKTPPSDPIVSIWAPDQTRVSIQVMGDAATATGQCRGLEGREDGFIYLHTWPTYDNLVPAWNVKLFRDWGCTGTPAAEMSVWDGVRPHVAFPDPADKSKPLVVKSLMFVPVQY